MMESKFYQDAANYWAQIPPTVEGVLGGFGSISDVDIEGSKHFLESILEIGVDKSTGSHVNKHTPPSRNLALDCGAGIGRITKFLLVDYFEVVDLVEQNELFLNEAKTYINNQQKLGDLYAVGLQNFKPVKKYDVIWCQWVLGHLNDKDLTVFFKTCRDALNENGMIFVKENVTSSNRVEKDEVDSSITRPLNDLLAIFKKCKLKQVKAYKQTDFPKGLYPVHMFALRSGVKRENVRTVEHTDVCEKIDDHDSFVTVKENCLLVQNLKEFHITDAQEK